MNDKYLMLDSSDIIELVQSISNKVNEKYAPKTLATQSVSGLMSQSDKIKLDGIATGANNYIHPISSGFKHIPSGGSSGQILKWSSDGTAVWGDDSNTTYDVMEGATINKDGKSGLVPAPSSSRYKSFLRGDGTWSTPENTTYDLVTNFTPGLISSADKIKLDGIENNANNYTHPTYIDKSSGFYKVTVTNGHVTAATAVAKSDITALGIPAQDTTYSEATTSATGLMSAADKSKLDTVEENANNYVHPAYSSKDTGLYKIAVDGTGHIATAISASKADITKLGIPAQDTTYDNATVTTSGLMSASDKSKLDSIVEGANSYTHPTTPGNKHIPAGGSDGQILRWASDGTAVWGDDNSSSTSEEYEFLTSSDIQSIVNSAFEL